MNNQMHTESALSSGSATSKQVSGASECKGPASHGGGEQAVLLLLRLFRRYPGVLTLRLWNGTTIRAGTDAASGPDSPFTLVFRSPEAVWSAVLGNDPLALADAYFRGELDIEGDFFAALRIKDHLDALQMPLAEKLLAAFTALRLRMLNAAAHHSERLFAPSDAPRIKAHSKAENRDAIHFHYDVSNEFYALWLDPAMVYSCAYFESPEVDFDAAQQAKLEHICRNLILKPGEKFLDIGCGWGPLVIYAAKDNGVAAYRG